MIWQSRNEDSIKKISASKSFSFFFKLFLFYNSCWIFPLKLSNKKLKNEEKKKKTEKRQ